MYGTSAQDTAVLASTVEERVEPIIMQERSRQHRHLKLRQLDLDLGCRNYADFFCQNATEIMPNYAGANEVKC